MWRTFVAVVGGLLSGPIVLAGDLTVTSTVTCDRRTATERLSVTDGRLLITQGEVGCIVEAAGRIVMYDTARHEYFETSFEEMAAYAERVVPKSKLIRKIMRGTFANLEVRKHKRESKTIAGYQCELYEEEVGAATYRIWATTALEPPASYYDLMEKAYAATSPVGNPISPIYASMREARAMPLSTNLVAMKVSLVDTLSAALATIERGMGVPAPAPRPPTTEESLQYSEVTEVSLDPIPPERFEAPSDLTRIESPYAVKAKKSARRSQGP